MMNEATIGKLAEALSNAQSTMSGAKKDKENPFYKSKYADLSSIFEALKVPFSENGLCISQVMDVLESGRTVLKTLLMHKSGQHLSSSMILPDIPDPQKFGGAITYFRRYALMSISGIPAEDDDGNEASSCVDPKKTKSKVHPIKPSPKIGTKKADEIQSRLHQHPEYYSVIQDYLSKEGTNLASLTLDHSKRIETKLNQLDKDATEALREAHG